MNPLIPECVRSEVTLAPACGFQFDKSPTRRIKGAHEGDADAEYHQPVACNNSCREHLNIFQTQA